MMMNFMADHNDTITGGAGNDTIDGGDGTDIAIFSGNQVIILFQNSYAEYQVVDIKELMEQMLLRDVETLTFF